MSINVSSCGEFKICLSRHVVPLCIFMYVRDAYIEKAVSSIYRWLLTFKVSGLRMLLLLLLLSS